MYFRFFLIKLNLHEKPKSLKCQYWQVQISPLNESQMGINSRLLCYILQVHPLSERVRKKLWEGQTKTSGHRSLVGHVMFILVLEHEALYGFLHAPVLTVDCYTGTCIRWWTAVVSWRDLRALEMKTPPAWWPFSQDTHWRSSVKDQLPWRSVIHWTPNELLE